MGANVIVKRAISKKDQLRTVLEAVVHLYVEHKHPEFVPKLHFIAFDSDNNLVVCSEQVESTSIHHYIMKTLTNAEICGLNKKLRQIHNPVVWSSCAKNTDRMVSPVTFHGGKNGKNSRKKSRKKNKVMLESKSIPNDRHGV